MANSRKLPVIKALPERVAAAVGRHLQRGARVTVGLSGGIDSVVLLDVMREAAVRCGFELSAVHVNPQINPLAETWAGFCRDLCDGWNIPLQIEKVVVPAGDSLEASARRLRMGHAGLSVPSLVVVDLLCGPLVDRGTSRGRQGLGLDPGRNRYVNLFHG